MLLVAMILITLCFVSIGINSLYGDSSNSLMFIKGSTPYRVPYEDWVARWWQWNVQIPWAQHPINPKVTECVVGESVGESGSVSFLTPRLSGIGNKFSCTIPDNHAILIPIQTGECTNHDIPTGVLEDMIECGIEGDKNLIFDASIDGVLLVKKENSLIEFDEKDYVKTKIFNVTIPEQSLLNNTDSKPNEKHPLGEWKSAGGGYFIFLKPLPLGEHTLYVHADGNHLPTGFQFAYTTVYSLKVQRH